MQICLVIHEILADKAFTATDGLISQSFVVAFVHSTYVQIALIWSFPVQLSLWKSVYWLWRYKLNEVCDTLKKFIEKNLNIEFIWLIFFSHSNLVLFIKKKDKLLRLYVNFYELNCIIKKDYYSHSTKSK